jgi:diaminopimelate epimerase
MIYFNSDGNESSMCGNGGRCLVHFAYKKGYIKNASVFAAIDGLHKAFVHDDETVSLQMADVKSISDAAGNILLDTGSPHYVQFVENADDVDVIEEGRNIRFSDTFRNDGINVNFVEMLSDGMYVRTYERGVEDETLSCGTGVTAAAVAASATGRIDGSHCEVITRGGRLSVNFEKEGELYNSIWLKGPALFVFKGEIKL